LSVFTIPGSLGLPFILPSTLKPFKIGADAFELLFYYYSF